MNQCALSDLCFFITELLKLAAVMDVTSRAGGGDAPSGARNLIMVLSEWVRRGNEVKILFACLCGFACQNLCT